MDVTFNNLSDFNFEKKRIEVDLLNRNKKVKRKIEALKIQRKTEELKHNQLVPKINPTSKLLASKSTQRLEYSPSRIQRTISILKNSRFMPKEVKISLEDLKDPSHTKKNSAIKAIRYDSSAIKNQKNSPNRCTDHKEKKSPSHKAAISLDLFPSTVSKKNELLFSLRNQTSCRGFQSEHEEPFDPSLPFDQRSQRWLHHKQMRLKAKKDGLDKRELEECTFKPNIKSRRGYTSCSTQRTLSSENSYSELYIKKKMYKSPGKRSCSRSERNFSQDLPTETSRKHKSLFSTETNLMGYNNLCPAFVSVTYPTGFSSTFQKKARPMISYKSLKLGN
jgi:hypothetical protein